MQPALELGEIHVWRADFDRERSFVQAVFELLSPDEKQKAEKYHFERDRNNFIIARGILRQLLGEYLCLAPDEIRFSYNRFGKPALNFGNKADVLRFNLSHSKGVVVYAFTQGQEVGIDIEHINNKFAIHPVAVNCFSPVEMSMLNTFSSNRQTAAFFTGWTRKEAYIKAVGKGVSLPLTEITVSLLPEELQISMAADDLNGERNFSLRSMSLDTDFAAALAVEGSMGRVSYWRWPENFKSNKSEKVGFFGVEDLYALQGV